MKRLLLLGLFFFMATTPLVLAGQHPVLTPSSAAELRSNLAVLLDGSEDVEKAEHDLLQSIQSFDQAGGAGASYKALGISPEALAQKIAKQDFRVADGYLVSIVNGHADTDFALHLFFRSLLRGYRWLVKAGQYSQHPDWNTVEDLLGRVRSEGSWRMDYPGKLPSQAFCDLATASYVRDRTVWMSAAEIDRMTWELFAQELMKQGILQPLDGYHEPELHLVTARLLLVWLKASYAFIMPDMLHDLLLEELKAARASPHVLKASASQLKSFARTREVEATLQFLRYGLAHENADPGYGFAIHNLAGDSQEASGYSLQQMGLSPGYEKRFRLIYKKSVKQSKLATRLFMASLSKKLKGK